MIEPAFLVIELDDAGLVAAVETALQVKYGLGGPLLVPLGNWRYVLPRAALKTMLRNRTRVQLWEDLNQLIVIKAVSFDPADCIKREYQCRELYPSPLALPPVVPPPGGISRWLRKLRAPEAWAMFPDLSCWHAIRVAHLDTGCKRHPCLGFAPNGLTRQLAVEEGMNYLEPDALPFEPLDVVGDPGRGTRVASVLAGNAADEFKGVAPGATMVPYRVTRSTAIDLDGAHHHVADALQHAVFDAGCDIVCLPLGDPCGPSANLASQIDLAYEMGVMVVAAAGDVVSKVTYPGRHDRVITVSAADCDGKIWGGAARGLTVDLTAIGVDVFCADVALVDGNEIAGYRGHATGTAYAAAQVTGAAVLWLAYHGRNLERYGRSWRRIEAFRSCLAASAVPPSDWNDRLWGAGMLDVAALLCTPLPDPAALTTRFPAAGERR